MIPQTTQMDSQLLKDLIVSGAILIVSILVALIVSYVLNRIAKRFDKDDALLDDLLRAFRFPAAGLIIITGIFSALLHLSVTHKFIAQQQHWFVAIATLLVVYAGSQAASIGIRWYVRSFGDPSFEGHALIYRKIVMLVIWIFAGVLVLDQLGYKITTIIAGLGIAGLAAGLALQDTIANLFSGFYLMVDRSVRTGDYIKLDTGDEGFVEYVGWRNTKIRVWANNIVLIPNAKLVQSVITNYTLPSPDLSVYVWCSVGYDNDLDFVEKVTLDAAKEVISKVPGADTTYNPVVRFKEFGDYSIKLLLIIRAEDVSAQYLLHHECMKALHKRYREEGIDISLLVQHLVLSDGEKPVRISSGDGIKRSKIDSQVPMDGKG
ncbi:MAG TPA: mechanosensitive ion channel family protein [Armatimonadota bacterium]|nr:mechanosensitive ion channel family protein [Armatimonadota bacterium]HOP79571.1 mechanosensitive ion channel family protein [Armatimonadota bacterium]HPP75944.1 mechanosensitive ion channel family protein [Armatimonadota bacterium]